MDPETAIVFLVVGLFGGAVAVALLARAIINGFVEDLIGRHLNW